MLLRINDLLIHFIHLGLHLFPRPTHDCLCQLFAFCVKCLAIFYGVTFLTLFHCLLRFDSGFEGVGSAALVDGEEAGFKGAGEGLVRVKVDRGGELILV